MVRISTSVQSSIIVLLASAVGLLSPLLASSSAQARVCDGMSNGLLENLKRDIENYESSPLEFHSKKVDLELYAGKNCDSPVKKYLQSDDYAKLKTKAYAAAAKASAKKIIDASSYVQNDDANVARFNELNSNIDDYAKFGGTSREIILRDTQVSEKTILSAREEAYTADLRALVERLNEADRILQMKGKEFTGNYKKLKGKGNSPAELIGRFEEAKANLGAFAWSGDENLKKGVESLDQRRLATIAARETCIAKPGFPNCVQSESGKILKRWATEVGPVIDAAMRSSQDHQAGERKLMEIQSSSGSGARKGAR